MKSQHRNRRARGTRRLEILETRQLMAADFRSFDGTNNNLANPEWGSTEEAYVRIAAADYADGISSPAGEDRPSAREISNVLADNSAGDVLSERDLSAFIYAWGQFLDHDIDLTLSAAPSEAFPIAVPTGDAYFDPLGTGVQTIGLMRSIYDPTTGNSVDNVRQQTNAITAFIDGSMVYGSDEATAASLRTFEGGLLKTSAGDLLPRDENGMFLAGDIRANENPDLLSLQTLFVREHNRIAAQYAEEHPEWSDEELYQHARRIVAAEIQAITYNEFLPALLGDHALSSYRGYDPNVNPGISNEFATAAYRLGHSMLGSDIEFMDNNGQALHEEVELRDAFFNSELLVETGIDPILKYLASDRSQEIDTRVVDEVRNFLFGPPGAGGFDLAALNIQRGRDHGLADYNSVRVAYGLPKVTEFAEITIDVAMQNSLRETYGSVDNIDLWVGGLAEDHVPGASVGPLFQRILADQFTRLRDGDRFWYQRDLQGAELRMVEHTSLAQVIRNNTTTTNLQENVFVFKPTISGRVYYDMNANGQADRRDQGLGGLVVELHDANGNTVASTPARRDGSYQLEAPELGSYTVHVVAPKSFTQPDPTLAEIDITTGGRIDRLDIGLLRSGSLSGPRGDQTKPQQPPPPTATPDRSAPPPSVAPPSSKDKPADPPPPVRPPMMLDPQMVDALFGGTTNNSRSRPPR